MKYQRQRQNSFETISHFHLDTPLVPLYSDQCIYLYVYYINMEGDGELVLFSFDEMLALRRVESIFCDPGSSFALQGS